MQRQRNKGAAQASEREMEVVRVSAEPGMVPAVPSSAPAAQPGMVPAAVPSSVAPSVVPAAVPSSAPSAQPGLIPAAVPSSAVPSAAVPSSAVPSVEHTAIPAAVPSTMPATVAEILTEAALNARKLAERAQESCNQLWAIGTATEAELDLADRLVDVTAERARAAIVAALESEGTVGAPIAAALGHGIRRYSGGSG